MRKPSGPPEVLVVHRPRYDDWTLPKGKNDPGESPEDAALREVLEETGQPARIVRSLGSTDYTVNGSPKHVDWFSMDPAGVAEFVPGAEVDQFRWLTLNEAQDLLTYDRDRDVLNRYRYTAPGVLYLHRHAAAGQRSAWKGDDRVRPLSPKGKRQANALPATMEGRPIDRIISSPYVRCVESVSPLAKERGLPIEISEVLGEGEIDGPIELIEGLVGVNALLSSHGDVIPYVIGVLEGKGLKIPMQHDYRKASTFMIEREGPAFVRASYIPPPQV